MSFLTFPGMRRHARADMHVTYGISTFMVGRTPPQLRVSTAFCSALIIYSQY